MGVLVVLAALAVGCSGLDSERSREAEQARTHLVAFTAAYEDVAATYQQRVDAIRAGGGAVSTEDPEAVLEVYTALREATVEVQARLAALDPPAVFEPAMRRLDENLVAQRSAFDGLLQAAQDDDAEALAGHLEDLSSLLADWGATNQLIAEQLARDA